MEAIGRVSSNLEHLNVSWCRAVTDKGISDFLEGVPLLQVRV